MKNVLVACEESQRVCSAFRKKGFNAFSCDLQSCSGGHPEWHIMQDVKPLLNGNCSFTTLTDDSYFIPGAWDLIIAHPPCTFFCRLSMCNMGTIAKGNFNLQRYSQGLLMRSFFMEIYHCNAKHLCIENPVPAKLWHLPCYSQRFQPYEFGEPFSKNTCLWLRDLPPLMPTFSPPFTFTSFVTNDHRGFRNNAELSRYRSTTFTGVANAMAEQWGLLL